MAKQRKLAANPPFHRAIITTAPRRRKDGAQMSPETEASEVLLALEKAARAPNFHLLDLSEVFDTRKWTVVRNM